MFKSIRLKIVIIIITLSLFVAGLSIFTQKPAQGKSISPHIFALDRNSVIIGWDSQKAYRAKISYYRLPGEPEAASQAKELARTARHKIRIDGLAPSTRYSYSLQDIPGKSFTFKTAPNPNHFFRFGIIPGFSGETAKVSSMADKLFSFNPEFIIAGLPAEVLPKEYRKYMAIMNTVSSSIPVFPVFLGNASLAGQEFLGLSPSGKGYYSFDWGAWHFISLPGNFLHEEKSILERKAWLERDLDKNRNVNIILLVAEPVISTKKGAAYIAGLSDNYKTVNVLVPGSIKNKPGCLSLPGNAMYIVEADLYEASGSILSPEGEIREEFYIKESPLKVKRTCKYCRQLMESGKYRESIASYRDFISKNAGNFQADDAQYEIASIYDHKLFEYETASREYEKLIRLYPDSTKSKLASNRLEYLKNHSGYNYAPLKKYEKIKSGYFEMGKTGAGKLEQVRETEKILAEFPDSSLADNILYWLANNLRTVSPEKSLDIYRRLIKDYPGSSYLQSSRLEITDVLYSAKKYRQAITELKKIRPLLPAKQDEIDKRIDRNIRNRRRVIYFYISLIVILVFLGLALTGKPLMKKSLLKTCGAHFILYTLVALAALLLWYERLLIIIPWLAVTIPVISLAPLVSGLIIEKRFSKYKTLFSIILSLLLVSSLFYVSIYLWQSHYLRIFGL